MTPPAVILAALVPAEGGDWGGGNPVAFASSTYRHFTSPRHARLVPGNPVIKVSGVSRYPLLMLRVILRWLPSFLWIPDTPVAPPSAWTPEVPRMTAGGGIIARLVPGNPDIKVSGVSRYPLLMLRVILRWLPSFLWIPDTPVAPPSAWTPEVPRMTAGGGIIARLVPGNPDIKVSGVSRYPLLMLRVILRWLPSFLWIPDTPVAPPSAWTPEVPRMTAGGGIIARLVPGNPVIKVSGVSRYPLLMLRVILRWLPSFLWIPDTPVRPAFGVDA